MKVSVFNDDKKTDLIGETWIDLKDVITHGGGQNDIWHNLNYKGKYAGEIRIEITYYDTRLHQERSEKSEQFDKKSSSNLKSGYSELALDDSNMIPEHQPTKKLFKRRPLPSDPVPRNESAGTKKGKGDNSISASLQYVFSSNTADKFALTALKYNRVQAFSNADHFGSPRAFQRTLNTSVERTKNPLCGYPTCSSIAASDHLRMNSQNGHQNSKSVYAQTATPLVEHIREPYVPYDDGPIGSQQNVFDDLFELNLRKTASQSQLLSNSQYKDQDRPSYLYAIEEPLARKEQYAPRNIHYETLYNKPVIETFGALQISEEPPPPPPIHRSRNFSQLPMSQNASPTQSAHQTTQDRCLSFETSSIDDRRISLDKYKGNSSYQAFLLKKHEEQLRNLPGKIHPQSENHEQTLDFRNQYNEYPKNAYGDVSEYPLDSDYCLLDRTCDQKYEEISHNCSTKRPSQAIKPQNSRSPTRKNSPLSLSHRYLEGPNESSHPSLAHDMSHSNRSARFPCLRSDSGPMTHQDMTTGHSMDHSYDKNTHRLSMVPINLVPGILQQTTEDPRNMISRDSQVDKGNLHQTKNKNHSSHQKAHSHTLPCREPILPHAEGNGRYSNIIYTSSLDPRSSNMRGDGRGLTTRKSVILSPNRPEHQRRHSCVPFGPESYNSLNPSINLTSNPSLSAPYSIKLGSETKIITYDGREIDPIDHIPESNYAPLHESKGSKYISQVPDQDYKLMPDTQKPSPTIGPRPPRHMSRPKLAINMGSETAEYRHSRSFESLPRPSTFRHSLSNQKRNSTDILLNPNSLDHKSADKYFCISQPKNTKYISEGVTDGRTSNSNMFEKFNSPRYDLDCYHDNITNSNMLPSSLTAAYNSSEPSWQIIDERRRHY